MNSLFAARTWLMLGFIGQGLFTLRFLVQWVASERARSSTVPRVFWWFSLAGGVVLFVYALHRRDPVFAVGQGSGLAIYSRNLFLIYRRGHAGGGTSSSAGV